VFRRNSIIVALISGLFLFISAPFSNANEGVAGVLEVDSANVSANVSDLLGIGSAIVIDTTNNLVIEADAYTFGSFDAAISSELVLDPASYVLDSSGILLQSLNENGVEPLEEDNLFITALQALVDENNIINANNGQLSNVTDAAGLSFDFTGGPGHNTISLDFILASGEYFEGDWDIAGIFINGTNYAFLPNDNVLRVNSEAQIANVCGSGSSAGCFISDYSVNGGVLGTISPKLTLYAPIDPGETNYFSASVANTDDNILGSYLLLSNFQSFTAEQFLETNTFIFEEEIFDFGIQLDAPPVDAPPVDAPLLGIPDPLQLSEITGISVSTADANNNVTITVTGKFIEEVRNIDVNNRRVSADSWKQTSTSITLTVPAVASGVYAVDIWNGSAPVLERQTVVVATK
jgi:hypothetical protein